MLLGTMVKLAAATLALASLAAAPASAQSEPPESPPEPRAADPATADPATADSTTGDATTPDPDTAHPDTTEPASADPSGSGPVLDLEGLDEPAAAAPAAAPGETAPSEDDTFETRNDLFKTLHERASAILDRTTLGGYGEHELTGGRGQTTAFRAHRFVLFVYSQIHERVSLATEIEWEWAGSPVKRDGSLDVGEVLLEFAVIDVELWPWLVLRGGVILMPMGSYNIHHDAPTQDLAERPIAYTTIVPSTWFESGAGLHGVVELPADQRLTYEAYVVNGLDARIYDGLGMRGARGSHLEDNNDDKAVVGRVGYSPMLGLEVGLSGYTGAYDQRQRRVNMLNVDARWRWRDLDLIGEVVVAAIDAGYVEGFSPGSPANTRDAVPTGMWGYYLQAGYHFTIPPLWELLPDWLQGSVCTASLRYEGKDTDTEHRSAIGDHNRLTLGLNYRPIEALVVKWDLHWNSRGIDDKRSARDLWQPGFWKDRDAGMPDGFVSSVAYLF